MRTSSDTSLTHGQGYVFRIQYHLVWCVKYRNPVLTGNIETQLKKELEVAANSLGIKIDEMECMPDHVHIMISCSPQHYIPTMIKALKGNTARRLFMQHPELKKSLWGGHLWNPSYFVATVSDNTAAQIEEYIRTQKTK